ncbi:hypothetical protein V8E51_016829 [Hyaloscypha variabilis]|uniref:Uncharacterized protein n=1 Tax=Hyaloscypha variabilis (strain UAMH 11265 / GT02V1 / F) TaxID=1149755 RepID=A0A2J6RIX5_HYAVF|nr:hypothetical protein L207DRAFT_585379 [Hyaloscypha variabilis F]
MRPSSSFFAIGMVVISTFSMVTATPVPCTDRIRDQVLIGELGPEACCSYGVCRGDVNVQGA